jgi:MoaA/NifB/PqqE/SkfB family radical SAM enzyme
LFWLDVAGGEPFLRKDLYKIVNLFKKQIVTIPTNGWLKDQIKDQISMINNEDGSEFVVNLSLDGLEKTHNIVRKNEQSWDKVWDTFEELKKIKKIKTRFITVIHNDNYYEIIPLMKIIKERGADFHSVILLRGDPLDDFINLPNLDRLNLIAPKIFDILESYDYGQKGKLSYFLKNYHRYLWKTSLETIAKKTQVVPCLAGKSSMVIWGEGNISACEMLPSFGNIKNKSIKDLMNSEEYKKQVESIKKKECHCTHNCSLITSITFNPAKWPNLIYQKKPQ